MFVQHISRLAFLAVLVLGRGSAFLLLPFLGASIYQSYFEQGVRFRENPFLGNEPILNEYDFVIVGAGPGGSVVANRLSENPNWKVLLLEAGEDETIYTDIPATVSHWSQSPYNWRYRAERTGNACLAMEDERCPMPRGKGLGGSSILNYMIYTRGHRADYDGYATDGCVGWGYDDVLPYFLKSENNSIPEYEDSPYHRHDGYLHVERVRYKSPLVDAFLQGGHELGYRRIDYTEPTQCGFSRIQATQRFGRRVSAAKAFLKSVRRRRNLHVSINSRVTRVLIDPSTREAYGVEFVKSRRKRVVFARKEVVLSAGAINSPQLLMLSGIGPRAQLQQHGLPVLKELPVGENLQEHYSFLGLMFEVNKTGASIRQSRLNLGTFLDWLRDGRGQLTLPGAVEGLAYTSTKHNAGPADHPDMELIFASGSFASDRGGDMRRSYGITDCFYEQAFSWGDDRETWAVLPMLLHPRSRGSVTLRDANPWHAPRIRFNYFEDPHDVKVLVEGIKEVLRLSETRAFQALGARLNPSRIPQCAQQHAFKSDEYWACALRYLTGTLHHQCGTCKMGPATDGGAVVDPELRVHGVHKLRVVDASVFPRVPGAHLYAPTLMVGEKASDMIKRAWAEADAAGSTTRSPYETYVGTSVAACFNETTTPTTTSTSPPYQRPS